MFVPTPCEETGQTMAEYAVMLGVITLVIVTAIGALSGNIATLASRVAAIV